MKKIIMLWLFAIISIVGIAQNTTEHLSYMGIPITGTITQFQTKLQAKRCSLDKQTSNSLGVGCRAFKGNFIGNKVTILSIMMKRLRLSIVLSLSFPRYQKVLPTKSMSI